VAKQDATCLPDDPVQRPAKTRSRRVAIGILAICGLLAGCATSHRNRNTETQPARPSVIISVEPSITSGKVTSVYVSVRNYGPASAFLVEPAFYALTSVGEKVDPIDPEDAVAAAGGEKQLVAGLPHIPRSNAAAEFDQIMWIFPWTEQAHSETCGPTSAVYNRTLCHGGAWALLPVDVLFVLPISAVSAAIAGALPEDPGYHRRIEAGAFHGTGFLAPGYPKSGYLFFPAGNYRSIVVRFEDQDTHDQFTAETRWQ
jgi:hypothetical protein